MQFRWWSTANEQMLQKVLAIKEQHFGEHHWQAAFTLNNLAVACSKRGNTRTQKELLERALKIFQDHLGEEHFYFHVREPWHRQL